MGNPRQLDRTIEIHLVEHGDTITLYEVDGYLSGTTVHINCKDVGDWHFQDCIKAEELCSLIVTGHRFPMIFGGRVNRKHKGRIGFDLINANGYRF